MPFNPERIHAEKIRIVRALFTDTADDNYIAARWCFAEALNVDFFWLGVHALEKYMKAVLLLNGLSGKEYKDAKGKTRSYGHNIEVLYQHVVAIAQDLLPTTLVKPSDFQFVHWHNETPKQFIERLHAYGNADNRYQIFGYAQLEGDLTKLDMLIFAIRRLCRPLDAYLPTGNGKPNKPTYRKMLATNPSWSDMLSSSPLGKAIAGKRGELLQHAILNLNASFAPKDYVHTPAPSRFSAQNPVLKRAILDPLTSSNASSDQRQTASELCGWVVANIQLPSDVEKQLRTI